MLFIPENGIDTIRDLFNQSKFSGKGQLLSKSDLLRRFGIANADQIDALLLPRVQEVCGQGVGKSYGQSTFQNMTRKADYDFLGVLSGDEMVAFIIAQRGECKIRPDWWAVKLICGRTLPGSGLFMLGAMLYAARLEAERIKKLDSKVVLELAGSYNNPAGFLTYSRLGFQKDLQLYYPEKNCEDEEAKRCFCEEGTMPMSCDLMRYAPDQFIDFMLARKQSTEVLDDTGMLESLNRYPVHRLQNISPSDKDLLEAKQRLCQKSAMKFLEYQKEARARQERSPTKTESALKTGLNKHMKDSVKCNLDFQQMYTDLSKGVAIVPAVASPSTFVPPPRVLRSRTVGAPVQRERKSQKAAQASPYTRSQRSKSGTKSRRMSGHRISHKSRRMSGHKIGHKSRRMSGHRIGHKK